MYRLRNVLPDSAALAAAGFAATPRNRPPAIPRRRALPATTITRGLRQANSETRR